MDSTRPDVQVQLAALRKANNLFAVATKREKAARERWENARAMLSAAKRNLKVQLEALQPELPSVGELPGPEG